MLISCLIVCLVVTSAHGKASWSEPVSACTWGHNIEVVNDVTLEECQEKCDSTFDCRSVDYAESGVGGTALFAETCWLSNVTSGDTSDFKQPCPGIYSHVLFSEKIGNAAPTQDSTTDSGTGESDWTCEFCTTASSALISHSTSTSSLEDDLALLAHVCPAWSDPDSCRTFLPTFWPNYGELVWSWFWSIVCHLQNCPLDLPEFWTRHHRTVSSPPSCQSCRTRINDHLDMLDWLTPISKFQEILLKFCDSHESTEECNSIGRFLIPELTTILKTQPRDWIPEICQQELNCKKDD